MNFTTFVKKSALISATLFMFTGPAIAGYTPGNSNQGIDSVDCIAFSQAIPDAFVLAKGGNGNGNGGGGNGGNGPGDGDGNAGDGPADGTGFGSGNGTGTGTGDCPNV